MPQLASLQIWSTEKIRFRCWRSLPILRLPTFPASPAPLMAGRDPKGAEFIPSLTCQWQVGCRDDKGGVDEEPFTSEG